MKTLIVYSSKTGNTEKIARAIYSIMPEGTIFSEVNNAPVPNKYDFIALGMWINRGDADEDTVSYINKIKGKKIAVFITLGAYPDSDHAKSSVEKIKKRLEVNNTFIGHFICQGKIASSLTDKFKQLPDGHPHAMTPERMARHIEAAKHPDSSDLSKAKKIFTGFIEKVK